MRAVLIVNPNATSTTAAGRDLLAHALESQVKLTVVAHRSPRPRHRDRPRRRPRRRRRADRARRRRHGERSGQRHPARSADPDATAPAVGVVPGGSANVFARALGISPDPIEATNQLVDLLSDYRRRKAWRRIGLMDCGERWAVFTAGMGVDGSGGRRCRGPARQGPHGHGVALYPRRDPRNAGQRPQGAHR